MRSKCFAVASALIVLSLTACGSSSVEEKAESAAKETVAEETVTEEAATKEAVMEEADTEELITEELFTEAQSVEVVEESESGSGIAFEPKERFSGLRCSFDVPAGFVQDTGTPAAAGNLYCFNDPDINVSFSVSEIPFAQLPLDNAEELMQQDYEYYSGYYSSFTKNEYDSAKGFVLEGMDANGDGCYRKQLYSPEADYIFLIEVTSPKRNIEECDEIIGGIVNGFEHD